ncbi:hypothetical protein [uncultured Mediterranean phage uvMED]|nr:hypothetical protein [uncultured Mediterranean phage uvMED]
MKKNKHDIPAEKVKMLASFGCTYIEIGKYFGCSEKVIRERFREQYEQGKEEMKLSLRQLQWKHAGQGNTALLIFLGKNYLNQTDKSQVDMTGNLETVLKEVGFQGNPMDDQADSQQREIVEAGGVRTDSATA